MKQVTIEIPDKKYAFFLELVKSLGFIKKVKLAGDEPGKEEILKSIRQSVAEVKQIKSGKLKAISAKDLLNEL